MTIPSSLPDVVSMAGDHVWQSTIVAGAAAVLAVLLRRNRAHVRHGVWLAASIKFLVPFAPLLALGGFLPLPAVEVAPAGTLGVVMETVSEPFSRGVVLPVAATRQESPASVATALPAALLVLWAAGAIAVCVTWLVRWNRARLVARRSVRLRGGREVDLVRRLAAAYRVTPLPVVASDTALEPGVFGIVRPVLLWPARLGERLSEEQAEAILAHELCHLRRRDNVTGVLHMIVQALFWFHPLVWWIGARLVEERERACDEEVVRLGSEPRAYAEGILTTCRSCVESRLLCVAGVTGSDLKQRIQHIMTTGPAAPISVAGRVLIAAVAVASVAAPVAVGALTAPRIAAQAQTDDDRVLAFEVASVKPNDGSQMRVMQRFVPGGGFEAFNVTVGAVIRLAYRLQDFQMGGEPEWVHVERFDILAKAPGGAQQSEIAPRLRALLVDRFKLKAHMETRPHPVYALMAARGGDALGPKIQRSAVDCAAILAERARGGAAPMPMPQPGQRPQCGTMRRPGGITAGGVTMAELAMMLAQFTGRMVVDRTRLSGGFDLDLDFAADAPRLGAGLGGGLPAGVPPRADAAGDQGVSIFTALEEQLGLRLVPESAPVDVLVIEHVERPSAD